MDILNHRLVDCHAVHLTCSKNTRLLKDPDTIVLHYTAGRNALSSALYLCRPDVGASAHLVIARDGELIQLVPFNVEGGATTEDVPNSIISLSALNSTTSENCKEKANVFLPNVGRK